jgi:hypothetical protein
MSLSRAVECRVEVARSRGGKMGAVARSQLIRVERFALTTIIGFDDLINESLELASVRGGSAHPAFIFFDLMQHQASERFLAIFRHLSQAFDCLI